MTEILVTPGVQLIAWTHFEPPSDVPWLSKSSSGQELAHFAGRACYQSWDRPRPSTATTEGYLRHILEVGHFSVLEHASATFYLTGISRSLTHELIRHRHLSYSQLSQRFTPPGGALVLPPLLQGDPDAIKLLERVGTYLDGERAELAAIAERAVDPELTGTARVKAVREAARAVLPNAEETKIVVTGNIRAWRHFIAMRATAAADREICQLAVQMLIALRDRLPAAFGDFVFTEELDGRTTASSPYAERS